MNAEVIEKFMAALRNLGYTAELDSEGFVIVNGGEYKLYGASLWYEGMQALCDELSEKAEQRKQDGAK